ncbi:MAG TPA: PilC/PilY family type IV pilus protein [Nitrospirota bacterium]|nr:PilC/PilY family type IV pilus protein [Nitrospirota bacterium]
MNWNNSIRKGVVVSGLCIVLAITSTAPAMAAAMSDYCSVPPFLSSSQASPNVMIMLDDSGSMNDHPFTGTFNPKQFLSGYYFGYFDPTKMYKYDSVNKMWKIYSGFDPGTTYADTTQPIASGNLLNWAVTRKMEVAKKLLVGGNPGIVSGTPNPRTVTAPNTIKLYTEDDSSSNNVSFDNSTANSLVTSLSWTAPYLVPGYSDVIYPFNGNFWYKLGKNGCSSGPACSSLSLTPINTGTTTSTLYPNGDISVASNWKRMNNLTTSATGSYYTYVDETTQDSDATTIANRVDTNPVIFNYGPNTVDLSGHTIQDVNVVVTARMVDGTTGACLSTSSTTGCYLTNHNNTCNGNSCGFNNSETKCRNTQCEISGTNFGTCADRNNSGANCSWQTIGGITQCAPASTTTVATRAIQGVLSIGTGTTANWASTFTNLNNTSSTYNKYDTYTFTWSTNPATGKAWSFNDIISGASTTTLLAGFGVQNNGSDVYSGPTVSCYVNISQVYLYVDATEPSGGPYSLVVDTGQQSITGMLDTLSSGVRFGLATYGDNSNGAKVLAPVDFSNMDAIAKQTILMSANGNTPLAESEYELLNYFSQVSPKFASNDYTASKNTNNDPYYFMYSHLASHGTSTANDVYVPCAKSYILLMSDGEPTADDYKNASGGTVSKPTGFTTDRFVTGSYLDDLTLWGRTTDMRPGTCSGASSTWTFPCIPSPPDQVVVTYPIFLFGTGSAIMQSAALNGGFTGQPVSGLPPCLDPANPTKLKSGYTQNDLKACFRFASDNTSGILNPMPPWGTGDDPPITYYEGSDAYALQSSLTAAIADMMKRSASGTAVSVLTTSSRGVGSMLQAYFLPIRQEGQRQVTWTGYTQNLWLYDDLREDTNSNKQLDMTGDPNTQDKVLKMYFDPSLNQTMAARFNTRADGTSPSADASQPGTMASCIPDSTIQFSDINYLWEGGEKLALKRPSARTIFTSSKVIRGSSTTNTFTTTDFSVTSLLTNPTFSTALNPDSVYSAENIVRYIRGECLETGQTDNNACGSTANSTYRDRRVTVLDNSNQNMGNPNGNVWKLGDIITSTPQVLGNMSTYTYDSNYNDKTFYDYTHANNYLQRSSMAFIGANDGMLHAFRVGYLKQKTDPGGLADNVWALFKNFFSDSDSTNNLLGDEKWAYIPFNAFPYLKYLADPTYCHIYYNDLPVYLVDVSIGGSSDQPTDTKTASTWRTVVIGSMRFGGCGGASPQYPPTGASATVGFSAFYAIDVTDAENPVPMWEFSDADLGYATSYPGIIRTGDGSTNGNWYVAIGSGSQNLPKTAQDISRSTPGYVYLLNLKTGDLVKKIALDHNAIVSDILSVDINNDYASEKIYFGTSYYSSGWKGKVVSIDIPNAQLSSSSTTTVHYLFTGNYPITAKQDVALDDAVPRNTWVYAGSGKYFYDGDAADSSQQVFMGFKDLGLSSNLTVTAFDDRTLTSTTGSVVSGATATVCAYDATIDGGTQKPKGFSLQPIVTAITPDTVTAPSTTGWYLKLVTTPAAERVISRPRAVGGLVDFLTYLPNGDPCNAGGNSYLYSVGYTTGTAPSTISIYSPGITNGTTGHVTVAKGILMGPGAPPMGESIIIAPKIDNSNTFGKKVQVSTGVIVELTDNPPIDTTSRVIHWLRK